MQKIKWVIAFIIIAIISYSFIPVPKEKEKIKWLTPKQLKEVYAKNPKPILFDIYTDWCGWCKVMDRDTYSQDNVISYINEKYYAVKYNAESMDSTMLGNKLFAYNPAFKANNLAVYLMNGQMSFPTTVFLSDIDAQPAPLAGYMKPAQLELPLKFFGDGASKTQTFVDYQKTFSGTW